MKKSNLIFTVGSFALWLLTIFVVIFFAQKFIPLQKNFLGVFPLGNFDGEHYVSIAERGYSFGEHAFFPLYPLLINFFGKLFGSNLLSFTISGIAISCLAFLAGLIGFFKLVGVDYPEKISKISLVLLLVFPTSFYFASVYTEALFFALAVWSFYLGRKGRWFEASLLGILLTATRFVGLIIFPALVVEWYLQNREKKNLLKSFPSSLLGIPIGLLGYMYYLERTIHNMIAFYSELSGFGEQRSSHIVTLPQVFYRYLFKIFPSLSAGYFPVMFTTILEFFVGLTFLILSVFSFFKIRLSYAIFLFFGYLVPTFSGSFSSLPRYVLVLFPIYILLTLMLAKRKRLLILYCFASTILLITSLVLFARGYWVS